MELFDIVDEKGIPTGETIERTQAHEKGVRHRTAHIWIVREQNGKAQLLLQKRSAEKDSFPGQFDTSSAGQIRLSLVGSEMCIRDRCGVVRYGGTGYRVAASQRPQVLRPHGGLPDC